LKRRRRLTAWDWLGILSPPYAGTITDGLALSVNDIAAETARQRKVLVCGRLVRFND
jgi:hypothetical protein